MSTLNTTQNITYSSKVPTSLPGASVGIAVLSLAFLLGFPGNAFVVWSAGCLVRKRTITCLLILHLAIADLVVLLTAPIYLRLLSAGRWELGDVVCRLCHYTCGVSMYVSVFLIAFMSLDRCLAVTRPFISQNIRTKRTIQLLVLAIWFLGMLLAIPMIFFRKVSPTPYGPLCVLSHPTVNYLVFHNLFETITGFMLPFVTIIFSYGTISRRLQETRFRRKRRTGRLISLIVLAFAAFWLPYHVVNFLDVVAVWSGSTKVKEVAQMARPTLVALAFFSSSINPILYAFSGGAFIRSAGIGFMAKLFEGTASEMSTIRHGNSRDHQHEMKTKLKAFENGSPEELTTSTSPTMDSEKSRDVGDAQKSLKSP
ncbi:leukotriene B4 receptor 1-like [Hemicordylus capensis]|uniref:leukotriene B4 receptor 1-like n=1 Tax=Hemicordylus capensis TaxID=884348 RepID=UPI00230307C3|nr:leukotriene B4 receptor 1-like [Hemicordylus capensis]